MCWYLTDIHEHGQGGADNSYIHMSSKLKLDFPVVYFYFKTDCRTRIGVEWYWNNAACAFCVKTHFVC